MSAFRLRRAGREFLVIDREALVQMAANGQVRTGDEVWFQERWQPVAALPDLQGKLGADPWDAWDESEGRAESIVARFQAAEPAELEEVEPEALEPAPARRVITRRAEPTLIPPDPEPAHGNGAAPAPYVDDAGDEDGEDDPEPGRGQVIDFPRSRRVELPPFPPNTPRGTPPLVRASRVFAWLFVGGAILAVGWLWMWSVGSMEGVQKTATRPPGTTHPAPLVSGGQATDNSLHDLLASLRGRLPQEVQSVHKNPDLGDAVLIELQNLQTSVEGVDAEVTKWTGSRGDHPKEATIVATFRDTKSLDRDLAAFGLVVGRYQRAYSINVPDARVVFHSEEGDQGMTIDASRCADLYSGRISLQKFLEP